MPGLVFSGAVPAPSAMTVVMPYHRATWLHIPRRDLVLSVSDSLALRVTVVESDDPAAPALLLTGGLNGPALRLLVWPNPDHGISDYGGPNIGGGLLWSQAAAVSTTVAGSFDVTVPTGTLAAWPRRCGFALQLTWDGTQSATLAAGVLNVRSGAQMAVEDSPLLSDDGVPVLIDALPTSPPANGGFWNNGGVLCIAPGPAALDLPTTAPEHGWWNNDGVVCFV